jgi:cytochrome c biogenesis protein CcmG, thiol:disulfide interchange protein DsbE
VVPQVGGGTIDLASLKGNPVWVDFMATSCVSCQDEFPLMNGFAARYANQGLVIIAVDVQGEEGAVAAFTEGLGASFPVGLDSDGAAAAAWDATTLPVHFWIDAEGIVRDVALGGIGSDVMVEGLKSIMPGVDVTP